MKVNYPIISADSHIAEAPNTYTDYIDPKWRDVAPHVIETDDKGDLYVIDGMKRTINMGLIAAADKPQRISIPKLIGMNCLVVAGIRSIDWRIRSGMAYLQKLSIRRLEWFYAITQMVTIRRRPWMPTTGG